jgi:hypothetical protein
MQWAGMVQLLDAVGEKGWVSPGRAKAARTVGVPVLVVAALVGLLVVVVRSGGTPQPQPTAEFLIAPGTYLDVELNPSARSFGSFAVRVRGAGWVRPAGRVNATSTSTGRVELLYDGLGYLDPDAPAAGTASSRQPPPRAVQLLLVGQAGRVDHTASLDLWVDETHYTIVSPGETPGAEAVVSQFIAAVSTHDWTWVYDLSDRYMRNGVRLNEFVTNVGAGAANRITEATTVGPMTHDISKAGASFARIPIRLTYRAGTATTTVRAVLVLVLDGGAWRVFSVQ